MYKVPYEEIIHFTFFSKNESAHFPDSTITKLLLPYSDHQYLPSTMCTVSSTSPLWGQSTSPFVGPRSITLCGVKVHYPLWGQGSSPFVGPRSITLFGVKVHHPVWGPRSITLCGVKVHHPVWGHGSSPCTWPSSITLYGAKVHHPLWGQGPSPFVGPRSITLYGIKVHHPVWGQGPSPFEGAMVHHPVWGQGPSPCMGSMYVPFVEPRCILHCWINVWCKSYFSLLTWNQNGLFFRSDDISETLKYTYQLIFHTILHQHT